MKIYIAVLLMASLCLNGSLYAFSAPSQKAIEVSKTLMAAPTDENVSCFIKVMLKEYKKANRAGNCDEAIDYLRAALYFLKPSAREYSGSWDKFNRLVEKTGFDMNPENRIEVAKNLLLENKFYASAFEFSEVLKQNYKTDVCYEYLGDISKNIDSNPSAVSFYKKAVEINPNNLNAKYKYAVELLKEGNVSDANYCFEDIIENAKTAGLINGIINIFSERVKQNPGLESNYGILGLAYQRLGQYDKTYHLLKKSLVLKPDDVFLRYHLGNLLFNIKEYSFADEIFTEILEDNPYESQIRVARAKSYFSTEEADKALRDYQVVLAMYPKSLQAQYGMYSLLKDKYSLEKIVSLFYPLDSKYKFGSEEYTNLGRFANKLGNSKNAVVFFEKAIALNPKAEATYVELYKAYQLLGENNKAKKVLEKAYKAFPKNPEILEMYSALNSNKVDEKNKVALSYLNEGEYEKAIAVYKQIEPKSFQTYEAIANCYRQLGDFKNAVNYYTEAAAINPESSDTYYALGVTFFEAGNIQKAKSAFEKSIQLNSKNIKSKKMLAFVQQKEVVKTLDLAYSFYEKRDYDNALKYLNNAAKVYPKDPKVYYYRALTKDAMGDIKGAVDDYRITVNVDRAYVVAYYKLGEALERINKQKEALYMYEKYLGAEKTDKELAKKAEERVIELGERYY